MLCYIMSCRVMSCCVVYIMFATCVLFQFCLRSVYVVLCCDMLWHVMVSDRKGFVRFYAALQENLFVGGQRHYKNYFSRNSDLLET